MPHSPYPYGRHQAAALAAMNMCAVITLTNVKYFARSAKPHR